MSKNSTPRPRQSRRTDDRQQSAAVWFTGLSGAGKSTLSEAVAARLKERGLHVYILDGDIVRQGLCSDLKFSAEDRNENIRRVSEVARLFVDAGVIVLCAFISPHRSDRESIRDLFDPNAFVEVFVSCPLEVCEERDVKGLYAKARAGEIPNFTGITAPYEEPLNSELLIETDKLEIDEAVDRVVTYMTEAGIIRG